MKNINSYFHLHPLVIKKWQIDIQLLNHTTPDRYLQIGFFWNGPMRSFDKEIVQIMREFKWTAWFNYIYVLSLSFVKLY